MSNSIQHDIKADLPEMQWKIRGGGNLFIQKYGKALIYINGVLFILLIIKYSFNDATMMQQILCDLYPWGQEKVKVIFRVKVSILKRVS